MRRILKAILPPDARAWVRARIRQVHRLSVRALLGIARLFGLNVSKAADYYSPLPSLTDLRRNMQRWNKPSSLSGIDYDLNAMQQVLARLHQQYFGEFSSLPPYEELSLVGYGMGFTHFDALVQFGMLRDKKPRRYMEVGSGLSTYYCSLAADRNRDEGHPLRITCVEPYPFAKLYDTPGLETVIKDEVQNVSVDMFESLEAGDVLFIDSSHSVRIDGDVPYLFLEVLPKLRKGVIVHIHDIPFPYNVPYPADFWVFGNEWPRFWTEAMIVQSFLAFNDAFRIELSVPLLRFHDEKKLSEIVPQYPAMVEYPNVPSSLWLEKVR